MTILFGKQNIPDLGSVVLHLFACLHVYFSSCLVLRFRAKTNGVITEEAEIEHRL